MRKPMITALAAAAALMAATEANAALLAYEGFDYQDNVEVAGLTGGTGFVNASNEPYAWTGTAGDATIQEPGLSEGGVSGTGNSLFLTRTTSGSTNASRQIFSSNRATGTYWLSLMIDNDGGHSTSFGFLQLADSNSTALVSIRFSATGNWSLQPGTSTTVASSIPSTSALLLAKIDMDADRADLWVNPTLGAEPTGDGDVFVPLAASGDFIKMNARVQTGSGSTSASFDEIRLGNSFTDVVPEPGMAAIFSGVGCMLAMQRKRRS